MITEESKEFLSVINKIKGGGKVLRGESIQNIIGFIRNLENLRLEVVLWEKL